MLTLLSYKNGEIIVPVDTAAQMFFGDDLSSLLDAQSLLATEVEQLRRDCAACAGKDPVDHWQTRMKSVESTRDKLGRLGLPVTGESALQGLRDLVGLRVVCPFIDGVYLARKWFLERSSLEIVEERDYIGAPKANGYRSCHLIVRLHIRGTPITAEIQLRTLAMDCWATLEHQLKYKNAAPVQALIVRELKRCADEIASTDWNLLSIREMMEAGIPAGDDIMEKELDNADSAG